MFILCSKNLTAKLIAVANKAGQEKEEKESTGLEALFPQKEMLEGQRMPLSEFDPNAISGQKRAPEQRSNRLQNKFRDVRIAN